ncbi:hypothetical protein GQ53DRAFT_828459 [Thozetella sp. PMI_491]|nr:hypothetical protein GQ53DRAFT_828459 [Thozetella sp. PMI_491]
MDPALRSELTGKELPGDRVNYEWESRSQHDEGADRFRLDEPYAHRDRVAETVKGTGQWIDQQYPISINHSRTDEKSTWLRDNNPAGDLPDVDFPRWRNSTQAEPLAMHCTWESDQLGKGPYQTTSPDRMRPIPSGRYSPQTRQSTQDSHDSRAMFLACPFYKKNPVNHHACLGYQLRRIKDVKQHIQRKHSEPTTCCPRCHRIFDLPHRLETHMFSSSCEQQPGPQYDFISTEQKVQLAQASCRRSSIEEKWLDIWDMLFPRSARPQSVYIGNHVEEMMPLFRIFWNKRQPEIVSSLVEAVHRTGADPKALNEVIGSAFNNIERETLHSTFPAADTKMSSRRGMLDGAIARSQNIDFSGGFDGEQLIAGINGDTFLATLGNLPIESRPDQPSDLQPCSYFDNAYNPFDEPSFKMEDFFHPE